MSSYDFQKLKDLNFIEEILTNHPAAGVSTSVTINTDAVDTWMYKNT